MALATAFERAAEPFDSVRRAGWRVICRHRGAARLLGARDRRLTVLATVHALVALSLAVLCPTVLLVLGPVLLGVPHVAADVRYLVIRRALPRGFPAVVLAFSGALVLLRVLSEAHHLPFGVDRAEMAVAAAWTLVALCFAGARARSPRRALPTAAVLLVIAALALAHPRGARLAFAQLHNVVALVLWATLFRRNLGALVPPLGVISAGALLLASGATFDVTLHHGLASAFGVHVLAAADWIAPYARADRAVGLTSAYVFLQSVHYAVWLVFVPQDDASGSGLTSFRASVRGLVRDFGVGGVSMIALVAASVVAFAFVGAARAERLYLSLAMFHGYLELALLSYFFAAGESRGAAPS
jgi:hypothetical protein